MIFEQVARLALQEFADALECFEAHAFDLAGFEERYIGFGDAEMRRQFLGAHFAQSKHHIESDDDGHGAPSDDLPVFFRDPIGIGKHPCDEHEQRAQENIPEIFGRR